MGSQVTEADIGKVDKISLDESLSKDSLQKIELAEVLADLVLAEHPEEEAKGKASQQILRESVNKEGVGSLNEDRRGALNLHKLPPRVAHIVRQWQRSARVPPMQQTLQSIKFDLLHIGSHIKYQIDQTLELNFAVVVQPNILGKEVSVSQPNGVVRWS